MKKVFILKMRNVETGEIKELSSWAFKSYEYAVEYLKAELITNRVELMEKKYNKNTDMTEILKGFIEVYETKKGQAWETSKKEPIKVYNYGF